MVPEETRNRMQARMKQWRADLEQLRGERKDITGEARREHVERLQELQAKISAEVRKWEARIDDYDADPTQTTQKEFDEQVGLRELERQITADLAAWEREGRGVG
jgi:septal ring factor EnvC (AmiA/AmiB activator)